MDNHHRFDPDCTIRKAAPPAGARLSASIEKAAGFGADLGPRQIRVLASTPTVDFENEIVNPDGMLNSPADVPIYYNHSSADPKTLPIGRGIFRKIGRRIEGTITFAPEGDDEMADKVCRACKSGLLDSVSVGFTPKKTSRSKDGKNLIYETWYLNEVSVVGIGCNPDARVTQRALGTGNPDRDARMARAAELRDRGVRRERAAELRKRNREIEREIAAAEAAAAPSHLDNMTRAERMAYARMVKARGTPPRPAAPLSIREAESQRAARHAALVSVHGLAAHPSKAERQIRAGFFERKTREVGRGG